MSRVRMSDFEESYFSIGRTWLAMGQWEEDTRRGSFRSVHGVVEVFTSRHARWTVTVLDFIHDGVSYSRRWRTLFGDKTIARLARELVEEVVAR